MPSKAELSLNRISPDKHLYTLSNDGDNTAYNLSVEHGEIIFRGEENIKEFHPGSAERFMIQKPWGGDPKITIKWSHAPENKPTQVKEFII